MGKAIISNFEVTGADLKRYEIYFLDWLANYYESVVGAQN